MNIKDMVLSLFGGYANNAKLTLMSQKQFLDQAANGTSFSSKAKDAAAGKSGSRKLKDLGNKQAKIFKSTFSTRDDIYEAIDAIKYLDLSQQIIETIVNDAFYSFDANEPFTIKYVGKSYDADEINARIQRTIQRLKLYQLFRDIVDDFVTYGEYYVETPCREGLGIAEINDTVDLHKVISIYDNYELLYHIATRKTSTGSEIVQIDKDALSHFVLDAKRIQVRAGQFQDVVGVPESIKIGKSVLLPVLKLLQRYNLLDVADVANTLKKSLLPPMITLNVGEQSNMDKIIEDVKKYEEYFVEMGDALHSIGQSKEITIEQLVQLATQVKIVPTTEGKGRLERPDLRQDMSLQETQDKLTARIKSTIGLPNDEEGKSRIDNLREKARYAKKLIDIQFGAGHSIANLILKDLRYQGILIDEANLEVAFKAIQNPNIEEDAENMFHLATSARDIIRTYTETAQDIEGLKLNPTCAKKFLDTLMAPYAYLDEMLIADPFNSGTNPEGGDSAESPAGDHDIENAGFIDKGGAPEDNLITPENEPEEVTGNEEPEPAPAETEPEGGEQ